MLRTASSKSPVISLLLINQTSYSDKTADTTQSATPSTGERPGARVSAYLSRSCNVRHRPETGVVGSWLRRSRVRAPPDTPRFAGETGKQWRLGTRTDPSI